MQIVLNNAQFRDQQISGTYPLLKEIQDSVKPGFQFMTRIMFNNLRARVFFNHKDYQLLDDGRPIGMESVVSGSTGQAPIVGKVVTAVPTPEKRKPGRPKKGEPFGNDLTPVPPPAGAPIPEDSVDYLPAVQEEAETYEQIKERISSRFAVFDTLTESLISQAIRAMIVSGAAGIGKTWTLEKALNDASKRGKIAGVERISGKVSAIGLYSLLYKNRKPGQFLILDDADSIFADDTALNVLKAALDSGDTRVLHWTTATPWLGENSIPDTFEYEGTCVFITNLDFDRMIARNTNIAEHLKAFISRSVYLDLGVHTIAEVMTRVEYIARETNLLKQHGITDEQREEILQWLWSNYQNLREVSIRTLLKLASFINNTGNSWKHIAAVTQLRVQKPLAA